jgi:putative membrane protein
VLTTLASTAAAFGPAAHVGGHVGFAFWPFFIIGPIFWLLVIGGIIFAVAGRRRRWARMGYTGFGPGAGHFGPWAGGAARAAETTLAERFAQGDIDEKEYRARLEVLRANNGPQQPTS